MRLQSNRITEESAAMLEIEEPTLLQTVRGHRSEVTCADANGARLVTGGGDRVLRLWTWERGAGWDEVARSSDAHRYGVTAARWAASGALLASGGVDGVARVWSGRDLMPRRLLAAPGAAAARALCWATRARRSFARAVLGDSRAPAGGPRRRRALARLHAHEGALHAVAAPARGALLLTACTHGVLKVFDLAEVCRSGCNGVSSSPVVPLAWMDNVHDLGALCADATEDGNMAATGGQDALIRVWHTRVEDGWPRGLLRGGYRLSGHSAAVTALRWAGWGEAALLASASLDRTARLWLPAGAQLHCVRVVHAHPRYLTCVVLAHDMRYMITGSNDRSLRMWSLGSLTINDELEIPCEALAHFGLGDLKGIGPLDDEVIDEDGIATQTTVAGRPEGSDHTCLQHLWSSTTHTGAINDIATHGDLVATASSDGLARVFRWSEERGELQALHELAAHEYPVLAVDFVAAGAVVLTAGLDGRACLWDVETGVQLRSLCVPAGEDGGAGGEAGGGGVRAARASSTRSALILLGTDDGLAPLWSLDEDNPQPLQARKQML
ncbi:WD repeat, SAM and U-box domain-containing protein 1-like [Spodoptera litura]|uniref:WD repeat, SAM and U-box domain-containing protein 1-like n=1 Tax=Spodoptera litura TaxID=69820 RepID=A0A9J7E9W6_SPOLT|nr:WD repeat, SAM and U-box domain-containing protein 1-like [Spodoptera litura]